MDDLYIISWGVTQRINGGEITTGSAIVGVASSHDAAVGFGIKWLRETYPAADGYYGHQCHAFTVKSMTEELQNYGVAIRIWRKTL